MLFNSYEFLFVFLPVTFFVYFFLNKKRLTEIAKGFLILSSLFFYSWWNVVYLPLIVGSIIFNYLFGVELGKKRSRNFKKIILTLGVSANLVLLGFFKYSDFLINNINFAFNTQIPHLNLLLPLAISFFTFQQIAYLVDSATREREREREREKNYARWHDFLDYCLFVTFFPQLIAGPIVHHKEMMPQFANIRNRVLNYKNLALGVFIFSIGLFKKVVIADTFATWATNGFDKAEVLNLFEAWATSLSYTFQLYFDFSGYCDMAIGAALFFNIRLPINFNSPYKALNIQDFWRRWHITLGRFLRDYIYIPLGGNRRGKLRTYVNLMAVFIIGGIWHGAGWTFVFWGFLHGCALVIHRIWNELGFKLNRLVAWFITFNFINIAWIFFRAKEFEDAIKVLKGMVGWNGIVFPNILKIKLEFLEKYGISFGGFVVNTNFDKYTFICILVAFCLILVFNNTMKKAGTFKFNYSHLLFSSFIFYYSVLSISKSEFLYFNF